MSSPKPPMYIYHLPYEERRKLCQLLDQGSKWEQLGKHMNFDDLTIAGLKTEVFRRQSPANELLTMWGQLNHTVLELFILLNRISLYPGMALLRAFVDDKYHVLIKEDNMPERAAKLQIRDPKVPTANFNKSAAKTLSKRPNIDQTTDNNVTKNGHLVANNSSPNAPVVQRDSSKVLSACVASSAGATPHIPYPELEIATENWNAHHILGQGGFGIVFKGTWKWTQVAIKRLETKEQSRKDFSELIRQSVTELHCLNAYRHDNILPLYGYSIGGPHPCLIYQYMPGGSLDSRIRTRDHSKVLSWPTRLKIATGTARGLQFLHTTLHGNKPLIHGDIKSANILLDLMDQPRIGDFGLAREGPERHYTHIQVTKVQGTLPYLPEEFLRSKQFSTKIDTYSFGVVLFELATARSPAGDNKRLLKDQVVNHPQENLLQLKDAKAEGGEFIFAELVRIGKTCVQKRAKDRPEMVSVLLLLDKVAV
ncbi:serine/threonine-protein kinase pelle [Dendroctonus ponderosae]|uniref:non-specific serine/threonine protein kinase n=1 Tax=Dendroctonus ponderosae TaxID=77166 RepID=U4US38_DENPD|nr:serine/threonine-protein kinase pelle [Dendroctonus ponderosae]ERL92890.1 hypothetical protein D910_10195 [Dendroctonus ponderosae]KAH1008187.1 hypothetical protein HUJ05_008768 [Dendroctonus ponderosae]